MGMITQDHGKDLRREFDDTVSSVAKHSQLPLDLHDQYVDSLREMAAQLGSEAIPALTSLTASWPEIVAKTLGSIDDPAIMPTLRLLLRRSEVGISDWALNSIAEYARKSKDIAAIRELKWAAETKADCFRNSTYLIEDVVTEYTGHPNNREVLSLVDLLDSDNDKVCEQAAASLENLGEQAVVPLIHALKSGSLYKVKLLDRIDPNWRQSLTAKAAVPDLIATLNNLDRYVRSNADWALEKIDPNWRQSQAAKAAVPDLIAALNDEDVAFEADKALQKITGHKTLHNQQEEWLRWWQEQHK